MTLTILPGASAGADASVAPRPAAGHRASEPTQSDPLGVTIDSLTPSVLPASGKVTITGTVTNTTDETWTGVNVYPLTSTGLPITTVDQLDAAAHVPSDFVVGERILEVIFQIPTLTAGQVVPYTLRVPRRYLGRSEGVHWLGVHALAQNADGRDDVADGKARTFLPLVRDDRRTVDAALVLQLRRRIDYEVDGRIADPQRWAQDLAPGGRLRDVVELGASGGDRPITWLMDPAVVATVNALVAGNASRMPAPAEPEDPTTESPTPPPLDGGTSAAAADPDSVVAAATEGQVWLDRLRQALDGEELLALPYGDVDASAASQLQPDLLADAQSTSATVMAALGLVGSPALGSPSGFLSPSAIATAAPTTALLVTDASVGLDAPAVASLDGHEVVLTSSTAAQGGPGPDDPLAMVAMRQRILSEAAVRLLSPGREPLVVALPADWRPTDASGFFPGLDVDWLRLGHLSDVTDQPPEPLALEDLVYPAFQQDYELDSDNFVAASRLTGAGETLQDVLVDIPTVGDAVSREAFTETAYWQRAQAAAAAAAADRSRAWIEATLGRVTVDGPPSVTLSSATGSFPATLHNGLEEPVAIRLAAVPSAGLTVDVPDVIELDAGESVRLRLSARTERVGAHSVRLVVAANDGTPLGATAELPIRSNQVSQIIWIIIVAGGGLLFGAIAVRLFRRFRQSRAAITTGRG